MKNYFILSIISLFLFSCSENETGPAPSIESCSNDPGFSVDVMSGVQFNTDVEEWSLEKNNMGGGSVKLHLEGSVNTDSASIRTYGDGTINEVALELNDEGEFDVDLTISFTPTSLPVGIIVQKTYLTAYYGLDDKVDFEIESCVLRY